MSEQANTNDPLQFVRNMWGNMGFSLPGMVAPTFDVDELEKRITDLKAVEGWLRMNLSMLQMTIQGLEMQKTTLTAVRTMGQMAAQATQQASGDAPAAGSETPAEGALSQAATQAAMWPWQMMQQMQEHLQQAAAAREEAASAPAAKPTGGSKTRKPKA